MSHLGAAISGDTLDIKGSSLLVGYYQGESALEILDLKMMKVRDSINWNNLETGKKGHFHIYSSQFLNKEDGILAGSWRPNDLRLFGRKSEGRSLIIFRFALQSGSKCPEYGCRGFL